MPVQLNHTIVHARDKRATEPVPYGPFLEVKVANGVSLDVADDDGTPHPQHYAFLVSEEEFDAIHGRIQDRGLPYWADPFHRQPSEINHEDGGRGLYWDDPDGHVLEILTVPYGGWG
jgi:extradiol dioxygenase family protein